MEIEDVVSVITTDEKEAKLLAMELANDTGRKILEYIFERPAPASEISKELKVPISTVMFHLDRFSQVGLVKVVDTTLSKKFKEVKHYGPNKRAVLIIPSQREETVEYISKAVKSRFLTPLSTLLALLSAGGIGYILKKKFFYQVAGFAEKKEALATPAQEVARDIMILKPPFYQDPVFLLIFGVLICVVVIFFYGKFIKYKY